MRPLNRSEKLFTELVGLPYGRAKGKEEWEDHWDFKYDDQLGRVEVKGLKRVDRTNENGELNPVDETIIWVETRNVYGNAGWLYGVADTFAFELKDSFLLVVSDDLRDYIHKTCTDKKVYPYKQLHKRYKRPTRDDVIILTRTNDIKKLAFGRLLKRHGNIYT